MDAADMAAEVTDAERAFLAHRPPLAGPEALTNLLCEGCGEPIPAARRRAVPGVRLCVPCRAASEWVLR